MGMLVFSSEAKELCLESWALAARALFHRAFINIEARYNVWEETAIQQDLAQRRKDTNRVGM